MCNTEFHGFIKLEDESILVVKLCSVKFLNTKVVVSFVNIASATLVLMSTENIITFQSFIVLPISTIAKTFI